ncbi:hypothetical protein HID58_069308 [Brassica napus]|uniref:Uncharacterized protein n=1 Tax=Brassica napus TaxID=3708 RepID=A0ABQ7YVL6_BRANA|nr:hypothetical protein HID58_069308 [Brassica napus]
MKPKFQTLILNLQPKFNTLNSKLKPYIQNLSPPLFSLTTLHLLFFFFNCSSETKHLDQTPRPHHVRLKKSKALISET